MTQVINLEKVCEQAACFKDMPTEIESPVDGNQRLFILIRASVILGRFHVDHFIMIKMGPQRGRGGSIDKRNSPDMHAPRLESASNFLEYLRRSENMLKHILCYVQIERFIRKRQ